MLIVIFLQLMEKTSFVVTSVDVVKRVVGQVVTDVAQTEGDPEEGEYYVVLNWNYLDCEGEQKKKFDANQNGRMN